MCSDLLLTCPSGETGWSLDAVSRSLVTFENILYQSRIRQCPVLLFIRIWNLNVGKWQRSGIRHRTEQHQGVPNSRFCQGNPWMWHGNEHFFPFLCKSLSSAFSSLPLSYASSRVWRVSPLGWSQPSESLFSSPFFLPDSSDVSEVVGGVWHSLEVGTLWKWACCFSTGSPSSRSEPRERGSLGRWGWHW